jgi:hypothetical protein
MLRLVTVNVQLIQANVASMLIAYGVVADVGDVPRMEVIVHTNLRLLSIEISFAVVKEEVTLRVRFYLVTKYVVASKFVVGHVPLSSPS